MQEKDKEENEIMDGQMAFLFNKKEMPKSGESVEISTEKGNLEDAEPGKMVYNKKKNKPQKNTQPKSPKGPETAKDKNRPMADRKEKNNLDKAYIEGPKTAPLEKKKDEFLAAITGPKIDFVTGFPAKLTKRKPSAEEVSAAERKDKARQIRVQKSKDAAKKILDKAAAEGKTLPMLVSVDSGEVKVIDKDEFMVGYLYTCDFAINQPDPDNHTVSRRHAVFYLKSDGSVFVQDQSLNGTFIGTDAADEESFFRLPKGNQTQIKDGMYIKFADVCYKFYIKGEIA